MMHSMSSLTTFGYEDTIGAVKLRCKKFLIDAIMMKNYFEGIADRLVQIKLIVTSSNRSSSVVALGISIVIIEQ